MNQEVTPVLDFHTTALNLMFLDATYCKVRLGGGVVSQAVVIATGVSPDGRMEVLGCVTGDSELKRSERSSCTTCATP